MNGSNSMSTVISNLDLYYYNLLKDILSNSGSININQVNLLAVSKKDDNQELSVNTGDMIFSNDVSQDLKGIELSSNIVTEKDEYKESMIRN